MNILKERSTKKENTKTRSKTNIVPGRCSNGLMLFYRWLIFLFSAVLYINGARFTVQGYAILVPLAAAAIYNGAVTAYSLYNGNKYISTILHSDIIVNMLLIYFSGGIKSDLYIFLFFIISFYGISNEVTSTIKTCVASTVLYIAACIISSRSYSADINYITLIIRSLLLLMAAYAVSRINYEFRRNDEMRRKEFKLARTDKLTGLPNRHYLDQKLKEEVENALSKGTVFNILLFDLDNFKGYNDTHGHTSGDRLLVLFSDIIRKCVRMTDIPIRYGGEEFMVLIRDLDIIIAKSVGDRIRRQLENQHMYHGTQNEKQKVTVSCGVAQFPTHSSNIKEAIERADQALYYAKRIGKNVVVSFDEIGKV